MAGRRDLDANTRGRRGTPGKLREAARRFDSRPGVVATAEFVRRLLPGDMQYRDPLSTGGDELPQHLGRLVTEFRLERPSAVRELGLGALQAWQALSEAQRRGRGTVDVAILFTDLVGFSSWALEVGDEAALELLRLVGEAEDSAVSQNKGLIVKRLGDGAMAVFDRADAAVVAALDVRRRVATIDAEGYTPELRAGVHVGRPRRIGGDYLGVDVNIAARVAEAAEGGQILVSEPVCAQLSADDFSFGPKRPLDAPGAPKELAVCTVGG